MKLKVKLGDAMLTRNQLLNWFFTMWGRSEFETEQKAEQSSDEIF